MDDFARVMNHLLGQPNVNVEDGARVADALVLHEQGLDFADALHRISSAHGEEFLSFDDRLFARRAQRMNTKPIVLVPAE